MSLSQETSSAVENTNTHEILSLIYGRFKSGKTGINSRVVGWHSKARKQRSLVWFKASTFPLELYTLHEGFQSAKTPANHPQRFSFEASDIPSIRSFIHLLEKSTQQTCIHDYERAVENKHLCMNSNNKNTKTNCKTQNTPAMPKTRTESS